MQKYTLPTLGFREVCNLFPNGAVNLGAPTKEHALTFEYVIGGPITTKSEAFAALMERCVEKGSELPENNYIIFCLWEDGNCTAIVPKTQTQWRVIRTGHPIRQEDITPMFQYLAKKFLDHNGKIGVFYEIPNEQNVPCRLSIHCVYSQSGAMALAEAFSRHVVTTQF